MDTADLKTHKKHVNSKTVFGGTNKLTLVIWFDLFIEELSPKRCWQGLRSQEVGEEGDST